LWVSADMDMAGMDMNGFRMIAARTAADDGVRIRIRYVDRDDDWYDDSAVPMMLIYVRLGRQAEALGAPLAATVWFVVGYFLVWVAFSVLATLTQWVLEHTGLLDYATASTNDVLGGLAILAVGGYQWSRLKEVCLVQCQTPFAFLMHHGGFRPDALGCIAGSLWAAWHGSSQV
jgi:predicted metal-binding membrane protein